MPYGRDGRNPYGAMGGYVRDRAYYDRARGRGMGYDYAEMDYGDMDYARRGGRRDYADYPDYDMDYGYDRHYKSGKMLDDKTVEMWGRSLLNEIEPAHQMKFKMDGVIKKAEEMGIRFDKFTPQEFYTTVVMLVSDFGKTLGMTNIDIYTRLAKDWLCDPDAGVKYGEKLAAYYHNIANV